MRISIVKSCFAAAALSAAVVFTSLPAVSAPAPAAPKKAPTKEQAKKVAKAKKDLMKDFADKLKHRFAPVIKKVTVGAAAAGKPISISVQAGYDDKQAVDKVSEVRVYFSADGGKKWGRPVKLSQSGADWKGQIPGQPKGTLTYYIWVKDSRGNVTAELPCKVSSWPPADDGCMVSGAIGLPKTTPIEKDIDIFGFKVGMDDSYVYLQQSVQGSIKKGTLSPTHINVYAAFMLDQWMVKQVGDVMSLLGAGGEPSDAKKKEVENKYKGKENLIKFMIYSPLLKSIWPGAKDCFMPVMSQNKQQQGKGKGKGQPGMPDLDTKNIACSAKGPDLFFKLNKSSLPATMKKEFSAIGALTMPITEQSEMAFLSGINKGDMLNVTRVIWNPRSIKVN